MGHTNRVLAFIGSYAEETEPSVYACSYDVVLGKLELIDELSGLANPTFLAVSEARRTLYALSEGKDESGKKFGLASAIRIDDTGKLSMLNQATTVPAPTCHIALDQQEQCLIVSSYHGGMVGVSPLTDEGQVGPASDIHIHNGGSGVQSAQTQARAHSAFIDRSNRYVLVQDLGADRIVSYRLDAAAGKLIEHGSVNVAPGAGPRHFAFHPAQSFGYVINELNSTITAFSYHDEEGSLTEIQTVSTLPDGFTGESATADIHISPDGRYVYGSNRGHDSIVIFAIDEKLGTLQLVDHVLTGGGHPRNFAISPDGEFLLAANRDGNHIVSFKRDSRTGMLAATGSELKLSKPVCVKITNIPLTTN
jgi:6-phosphogluconolactonase